MFKNYLKVALRNFWKNKTFSLINIVGLAIGLCCFLLIAVYVLDELSYDRFHEKADRIYRVNSDIRFGGNELSIPQTSDMMGASLKGDYPQVEEYTRLYTNSGNKLVKKGSEYINEFRVAHADSTFFALFTYPAIAGNTKTALDQPNTVVITESTAKKYFGTSDVLGKTIETNDDSSTIYKVTAVIHDMPRNGHFNFDFLFSMKNVGYQWGQYLSHNFNTYLLLKKGTDFRAFEKKFPQYIDKYVVPQARQYMQINSIQEFEKAGNKIVYTLTPLTDIHLRSDRSFEISPSGNIQYVYIFSAIALFILLLACINFMNLTTARSANRAREVGIRKVLGTQRKNLLLQFLTESTLMVFFSLVIAIGLTYFVLPLFNNVSGKTMSMSILFSPLVLPLLVALPLFVGLLAGSYPAFYLSFFKPIEVLKGQLSSARGNGRLRSTLVVFQFATAIVLIVGTMVVYSQLNYIRLKDLGFKKDQVLIVNDAYALNGKIESFKNEMLQQPGVAGGTISSYLPVSQSSRNDNSYSRDAVMDSKNGFNMQSWTIDYDYLKTMGMEIKSGRNFSKDFGTDTSAVIINETAAKFLNHTDPIGKKIYSLGSNSSYTIIGVVKNFNFESLHKTVGPLAFFLGRSSGLVSFKVKAANIPAILKTVEGKWKAMAPGMPFSYRFMDDSFAEMYQSEQRAGKIALIFSVLAIVIACLGLFGLATFIAEQRTKEIGIRKVLGANVAGIVGLLSRNFVRLVFIAFVIATPVAWWVMSKWLQDFEYRIQLSWWIFLLAGLAALLIALFTVSFQAIKAAVANPVKNLRTE